MVFGTFDGIHKGHLHFFKQARALAKNPYLIVSVARDKNVLRIKGIKTDFTEKERVQFIKKTGLADTVVLGGVTSHLPHIMREHPLIIGLGYDQDSYTKNLKQELQKKGLVVKIIRLKPYKKTVYKNHLLKQQKKSAK